MTPITAHSLHPSWVERQQIEPHEGEVVGAIGAAKLIDPRQRLRTERPLQLWCEVGGVRLHGLAREPTGDAFAIELATLSDGVHVSLADIESDVDEQVEIGAGVNEGPGRPRRRRSCDVAGDGVEERNDLA